MPDLVDLALPEIIAALRQGEFSSRELTQAYLHRIGRLDRELHVFLTLTPELALRQAEAADRQLSAWRKDPGPLPPLLGVPVAVKDVLCVAGVQATAGSRILEGFVPPFNARSEEHTSELQSPTNLV